MVSFGVEGIMLHTHEDRESPSHHISVCTRELFEHPTVDADATCHSCDALGGVNKTRDRINVISDAKTFFSRAKGKGTTSTRNEKKLITTDQFADNAPLSKR